MPYWTGLGGFGANRGCGGPPLRVGATEPPPPGGEHRQHDRTRRRHREERRAARPGENCWNTRGAPGDGHDEGVQLSLPRGQKAVQPPRAAPEGGGGGASANPTDPSRRMQAGRERARVHEAPHGSCPAVAKETGKPTLAHGRRRRSDRMAFCQPGTCRERESTQPAANRLARSGAGRRANPISSSGAPGLAAAGQKSGLQTPSLPKANAKASVAVDPRLWDSTRSSPAKVGPWHCLVPTQFGSMTK